MSCIKAPIPNVPVFFGSSKRVWDKYPLRYFGRERVLGKNKRYKWSDMDAEAAVFFFKRHTHVGNAITENSHHCVYFCKKAQNDQFRNFSCGLKKRMNWFIRGGPDPFWGKKSPYKQIQLRKVSHRVNRLCEVLKTIDGILLPRDLVCRRETWNWALYDRFVMIQLAWLITDEFFDGVLIEESQNM